MEICYVRICFEMFELFREETDVSRCIFVFWVCFVFVAFIRFGDIFYVYGHIKKKNAVRDRQVTRHALRGGWTQVTRHALRACFGPKTLKSWK